VAFFCFVAGSTTLEAKMKIVGAVMLLGLVFIIISPAFGLEKTTPGITSTVYCRCTCATISGLGATEKKWVAAARATAKHTVAPIVHWVLADQDS
jgi:hypothetical protein